MNFDSDDSVLKVLLGIIVVIAVLSIINSINDARIDRLEKNQVRLEKRIQQDEKQWGEWAKQVSDRTNLISNHLSRRILQEIRSTYEDHNNK